MHDRLGALLDIEIRLHHGSPPAHHVVEGTVFAPRGVGGRQLAARKARAFKLGEAQPVGGQAHESGVEGIGHHRTHAGEFPGRGALVIVCRAGQSHDRGTDIRMPDQRRDIGAQRK
ncbi:Uncharacterised protein [Mycobacteroides abscessus subsp. abscessus]|nr:Uncharacterised protein [Mycobacteroides abscessus subsp. abscessus]SLC93284.1 Uncharacterised protein [Mycobacteroides abscessus subsp. massiliense]